MLEFFFPPPIIWIAPSLIRRPRLREPPPGMELADAERFGEPASLSFWELWLPPPSLFEPDPMLWLRSIPPSGPPPPSGCSFFHFSAGSGWSGLKGFDISPPKPDNFIQEKLANVGGMYVVQATKSAPAPVTEADPEVGLER